jgi:hypothetical protein
MTASTVRQIHSIINGALSAAVRWGLAGAQSCAGRSAAQAETSGARSPSLAEAARLVDEAFRMDEY